MYCGALVIFADRRRSFPKKEESRPLPHGFALQGEILLACDILSRQISANGSNVE